VPFKKKTTKGPSIKRNQTQFKENIYYVQVSRLDAVCLRWLEGNEGPAVGMRSKLMETCPHLITTQQHKGRAVTHVEGIESPGDKPAPELTGCPRRLLPRAYEVRDRKDAGPQIHSSPQSLPNPDSTRGLWGLASFKEHHAFEVQPCHSRINASFPYTLESWSPGRGADAPHCVCPLTGVSSLGLSWTPPLSTFIHQPVCGCMFHFSCVIPRSGIAGSQSKFNFLNRYLTFLTSIQRGCTSFHSHQ